MQNSKLNNRLDWSFNAFFGLGLLLSFAAATVSQ